MVFSSVTFLFMFLPASLLLYYIIPDIRWKNVVLFFVSLVFYAWGEPVYVILMLYSILLNYAFGRVMGRTQKYKKQVLVFLIVMNLLILGFFKYYGFLMDTVNSLTGLSLPVRQLALPVGISFYTFQALSYDIDLYRGKFPPQKNFIAFGAYITMFPQLIAGPIVRYEDIERQLTARTHSLDGFGSGALRFTAGLGKKVLLANLCGSLFDTIQASGGNISTATAWIGTLAYAFQIYFDFSGYSDMAIGLGECMGFSFRENFEDPYACVSVTDFWRRWHISLGTWFREYVYIPLGGNRVSTAKHIRNILVVWLLTGLWHGASWNFVLWGLYYALLLILEKYVFLKWKIPSFIRRIFALAFVLLGWIIFYSQEFPQMLTTLAATFGFAANGVAAHAARYYLTSNAVLFGFCLAFCIPATGIFLKDCRNHLPGRILLAAGGAAVLLLSVAFMVTENYNPFLYFRF